MKAMIGTKIVSFGFETSITKKLPNHFTEVVSHNQD